MLKFEAKEWGDKTLVSHKGGNFLDINIPPAQMVINMPFKEFSRRMGLSVDHIFKDLTLDECEFLISGLLPETFNEWTKEE